MIMTALKKKKTVYSIEDGLIVVWQGETEKKFLQWTRPMMVGLRVEVVVMKKKIA